MAFYPHPTPKERSNESQSIKSIHKNYIVVFYACIQIYTFSAHPIKAQHLLLHAKTKQG